MATARFVAEAGAISPTTRPLIGVLGGTFDPVHVGHLRLALELLDGLPLRQVLLVPSGQPPHRAPPHAGTADRLALLRCAVRGSAGLRVDARETLRSGPSYMVDTLGELRRAHPRAALCLVLGADAFAALPAWHRWRELFDLAHLVVVPRPGFEPALPETLSALVADRWVDSPNALCNTRAGRLLKYPAPVLDISATRIRALLRAGHSVRHLVPPSCLRQIQRRGLYSRE